MQREKFHDIWSKLPGDVKFMKSDSYLILWPSEWKITRKWSNWAQCVTCRALWQIIDFFSHVSCQTSRALHSSSCRVRGRRRRRRGQRAASFTPLFAWHKLMAKWPRTSARRWFGLASPPRRPQMTRWHSGRLIWRRQKGHAAPRATDVTSVARSVWGGADKIWVSPAWTHSSPELFQSPFTINTGRKAQCSLFFSLFVFFFQINSQTRKILFSASSATVPLVC